MSKILAGLLKFANRSPKIEDEIFPVKHIPSVHLPVHRLTDFPFLTKTV